MKSNVKMLSFIARIKSIILTGMNEPSSGRRMISWIWLTTPKEELELFDEIKAVSTFNEIPSIKAAATRVFIEMFAEDRDATMQDWLLVALV